MTEKMSKNIYKKWNPFQGTPDSIYLKSLRCDYYGLTIILDCFEDRSKSIEIFFDAYLSYRSIDEGDLLVVDEEDLAVQNLKNNKKNRGTGGLLIIDYSSYLEWFDFVSQGIHDDENIIHYGIYTCDDCIDILSAYPPSVKWLE